MEFNYNLLDLPDLVLYNICVHITDPFDLLCFGNTCTRLRKLASSHSLWWSLAFRWCNGLWLYISCNPDENHPREWLLEVLKSFSARRSGTELKCKFSKGEKWERVESCKFRCLVGMLRSAYERHRDNHPAVLYEQWLYDIGLYRRVNVKINFTFQNLEFSKDIIKQLTTLGQAAERDLRRRKQPNKDPRYYIKQVCIAEEEWMSKLFPTGPHGSICPLLMCPFQDAVTNEVSGIQGLSTCLSIVLGKILKRKYRVSLLSLKAVQMIIKTFCTLFIGDVMRALPTVESRLGNISLKSTVLSIVNERSFSSERLQNIFSAFEIDLPVSDILKEFSDFLQEEDGIDMIVDKMRAQIREAMFDEINHVLFNNVDSKTVTRVNLTDSDLIDGDNSRQEMSSAAFISQAGVLVTWHLTGRMRF